MTKFLSAVLLLSLTIPSLAQDNSAFERQLKIVEDERDALRRELALAKLKIASLESKVEKLEAAGKGDGSSTTTASATAEAEDDTDEDGISRTANSISVKVISKKPLDASQIESEINQLRSEVANAKRELAAGTARLDKMRRDNEYWDRWYRTNKNKTKPFDDNVIAAARLEVQKAQTKERVGSRRILGLEREKAEAAKTLVVTCESTVDQSVIRVMAKGTAHAAAEAMQEGKKYLIEGRKGGVDVILLTKVTIVNE